MNNFSFTAGIAGNPGNLTFGTPQPSTTSAIGALGVGGFSFGTPQQKTAATTSGQTFGGLGGGISFGTPQQATANSGTFGGLGGSLGGGLGGGGLSFATPQATAATTTSGQTLGLLSGGLSFVTPQSTAAATTASTFGGLSGAGLNFGNLQQLQQTAATTSNQTLGGLGGGGFSFGTAPSAPVSTGAGGLGSSTGFSFGTAPLAAASTAAGGLGGTGFSLGTAPAATTTTAVGLSLASSLPQSQSQQKLVRFDTPATATSAASNSSIGSTFSGGLGLATTSTAAASGGSTLSGLLAGKPVAAFGTPATTLSGFGLGSLSIPAASNASTSTTSLGFGLGGSSSVFGTNSSAASSVSQGLGGTDPKFSIPGTSGSSGTTKTSDPKALKENPVLPEICLNIDEFSKHVKAQKTIRESIARMSSKPLFRVEEDLKNLRQRLLLVSSGLQKNSATIDKLKRESTQELKHAEIAQRTKDTPPGLQYENIAPTEYFQRLTEEFEAQMVLYRQQIVDTENYLASISQSSVLSPQELSTLFVKLNDGFVALAAQLQVVHEAVKAQKEQYLNYRRMFLSDGTDIFEKRKKVQNKSTATMIAPTTIGPTPFSPISNAASVAMTSAVNQMQPAASVGTGFGMPNSQTTSAGFFGTSSTAPGFGLASTSTAGTGLFGSGTGLFGASSLTGTPAFGLTSPANAALQKPTGSKRGKNA